MHHCLFVPHEVIRQHRPGFLQRFADAGDVAVAEDAEHAADERLFAAVAHGALLRKEADDRLRRC